MTNDVTEIRKIVRGFRKGLLKTNPSESMCFVVCFPLSGYLRLCGYDCRVTEGKVGKYQHFWITLKGGIIVDPTANQFKKPNGSKMPSIYIGEKPVWYKALKGENSLISGARRSRPLE